MIHISRRVEALESTQEMRQVEESVVAAPGSGGVAGTSPHGDFDLSFVSAANGVIYAGSLAAAGTDMYALDAATGTILWSFASGGSVTGGAAIADGSVYWGSGYCGTACLGSAPVTNNNKVYAFSLGR